MRRSKIRRLTPPERALSYETFCRLAGDTVEESMAGSLKGWNLVASVAMVIPGMLAILFFIRLTDPDPQPYHWVLAFLFTGVAVWIFSYPMATGFRGMRRYSEIQRLDKIWVERAERGQVPRWQAEVEGFVPPPGSPPWPDPAQLARAEEITDKFGTERNPVHSKVRRVVNWTALTLVGLFVLFVLLSIILVLTGYGEGSRTSSRDTYFPSNRIAAPQVRV